MTVERMIELLEIEKECVLRNASGECNRYCAGCDLLQDDTELHEMYTESIALLKAHEPSDDWISRKRLKDEIQYYIEEAGWGEEINKALGWCLEFIDNQEAVKWE